VAPSRPRLPPLPPCAARRAPRACTVRNDPLGHFLACRLTGLFSPHRPGYTNAPQGTHRVPWALTFDWHSPRRTLGAAADVATVRPRVPDTTPSLPCSLTKAIKT
jgi:hypothetical protein